MISSKEAGYWELSLRDSLGAKPIVHDRQTCVFFQGAWWLVPADKFLVKELPRLETEALSAAMHVIECGDDELADAIKAEAEAKGKRSA